MDLKTRKYINNTSQLPAFKLGEENWGTDLINSLGGYLAVSQKINTPPAQTVVGKDLSKISVPVASSNSVDYGGIAQGAIGALQLTGAFAANSRGTINPKEMVDKYGTSDSSIDRISYQTQNGIDIGHEMSKVSQENTANTLSTGAMGAATGFAVGGRFGAAVGGAMGLIGGLISGDNRRRRERRRLQEAQLLADAKTEYNRSNALTQSVQNKQAERYGDTSQQSLYSAAYGSEGVNPATNETYKKFLVQTPNGKKYAKQNAWLDAGEYVEDARTGASYKVQGDPRKTDGVRGRVNNNTRIASKKIVIDDSTGATTADLFPIAKALGWTDELFEALRNKKQGLIAARYGIEGLPGYAIGWENIAATAPGLVMSIGDLLKSKSEDVAYTNELPYNKYEGKINELMAGRRGNYYPISQQLLSQEGGERYRTRASGGLSTAQRVLANIAGGMNTRQARANALLNIQNMNNLYAKEYADALNTMGTHLMQSREQARQFNTQMNNAAHNAWILNQQMAKRNILDYATQFAKNAWEKNQFDKMYSLYAAELRRKQQETDHLINGGKTNSSATQSSLSEITQSPTWGNWFQLGIVGKLPRSNDVNEAYRLHNIYENQMPYYSILQLNNMHRKFKPQY